MHRPDEQSSGRARSAGLYGFLVWAWLIFVMTILLALVKFLEASIGGG